MRLRASRLHKLATDGHGERQIRETVAMQVPELAAPDAEFDSAESVRRYRDAFP